MTLTHLTPADYVTTQWSGGATTQLAIAPKGAVYADRDFLWRLSSATVELDESDFTPLPAYDRVISTLRGDMVPRAQRRGTTDAPPLRDPRFLRRRRYPSWGRCTDFNLMLRRGQCRGCVTAHFPHGTETLALHAGETALLFLRRGKRHAPRGHGNADARRARKRPDRGRARAAHRRGQREADACADVPLREGAA